MAEHPGKPPDLPATGAPVQEINELLQNPVPVDVAATLGLLDDPTTPLGSALDSSNMLLSSGLIEASALLDLSASRPTNGASAESQASEKPQPDSAKTGSSPPLNIPDINQLASSLMAAAMAEMKDSEVNQPAQYDTDSSSSLNPPLSVPDISQFTTSSVPQTASSQPEGLLESTPTPVDSSPQISKPVSVPDISHPTSTPTSVPTPLVTVRNSTSENSRVLPPINPHVGGTLQQSVTACQPLGTNEADKLTTTAAPASSGGSGSQGVVHHPVESSESSVLQAGTPSSVLQASASSSGRSVDTSVQTMPVRVPPPAPNTSSLPIRSSPLPANVPSGTKEVPASLQYTTVGNLLASAIASSVSKLSSPATSLPSVSSSSSHPSPAASSLPVAGPGSASLPKGLNLPLLQFLQLNFPHLRLENIKDILQVNAILANTLQQKEQQKAAAAQKPHPSSSPPVAATPLLAELKVKPSTSPLTLPFSHAVRQQQKASTTAPSVGQASASAAAGTNKGRVFAQIIRPSNTKVPVSNGNPVVIPKSHLASRNPLQRSSPLILQKQTKAQSDLVNASLASISTSTPSPLTMSISTRSTRSRLKQDVGSSGASLKNLQHLKELTRTVIQPADSEMEVDVVGQPLQSLNLPAHLKDHCYSLYNPEEGERMTKMETGGIRITSTIPPARLSYAPQVSTAMIFVD